MSREAPRKSFGAGLVGVYLLLTAVGLIGSYTLYGRVLEATRRYYGIAAAMHGGAERARDLGPMEHCDIIACIRTLSEQTDDDDIKVEACDVHMYSGAASVVGLLGFLLVYFCFVVVGFMLVAITPTRCKRTVLIIWSVVFFLVAMPLRPAIWLLELVAGLFLLWRLRALPLRARAFLMLGITVAFYILVGPVILDACASNQFSLTRITIPGASGPAIGRVNHLLKPLRVGQINEPRGRVEGFPYLFVALALLLKFFRRVLRFTHELWNGYGDNADEEDFLVYFIGLPMLIGEAYTPSFSGFSASRGRGPDIVSGTRTLAWSLGFCALAQTALLTLGYSPAVRVLFPHCNLANTAPAMMWAKLVTTFVIGYVFLVMTTQTSVAVSRMFGYGVRDNFESPLQAVDPADFWRRWNVHWREFLVTVFYYPTLLFLARRSGGTQKARHVVVATMLTFMGTLALNVIPLVLLTTTLSPPSGPADPLKDALNQPQMRVAISDVHWKQTLPSLLVYYTVDGIAVAVCLAAAMRRRRPTRPKLRVRNLIPSIVLTFFFMAAIRCFLDSRLPLADQLRSLARALGLGS